MPLYTHPKIQAVIQIDNKENLEKKVQTERSYRNEESFTNN